MALVTLAELQARPGFATVDPGELQAVLDDANGLVTEYVAPLLDDVDSPDTPVTVRAVIVSMCRRAALNPRGLAQEALGDYSYSSGSSDAATIYMTRHEQRQVRRAVQSSSVSELDLEGYVPTTDLTRGVGESV